MTLMRSIIKNNMSESTNKGQAIRFIAGKYGGKKGWIDLDSEPGSETIGVIVNRGGRKGEYRTYVQESSIVFEGAKSPSSYAEAVVDQCPDLERMLVSVCRAFAKCDIARDVDGFQVLVLQKLHDAILWQQGKGSKAYYRVISFVPPQVKKEK